MCGICVRMATCTGLYIDTLGGLDLDGSTDKNLPYFVVEIWQPYRAVNMCTCSSIEGQSLTRCVMYFWDTRTGIGRHQATDSYTDAVVAQYFTARRFWRLGRWPLFRYASSKCHTSYQYVLRTVHEIPVWRYFIQCFNVWWNFLWLWCKLIVEWHSGKIVWRRFGVTGKSASAVFDDFL